MERGADSSQAPIRGVREFLDGLHTVLHRDRPLAPATIVWSRSAKAAIHQGFPDGSMVSLNKDLSILLKGIYVVPYYPAYTLHPIDNTHPLPKSLTHM